MTEIPDMTDEEIADRLDVVRAEQAALVAEQSRRRTAAELPTQIEDMVTALLVATGREQGAAWVQPTGYHDAYPLGWVVAHDGREWESLRAGNPDEPGVVSSSWREIVPEGAPPPEWEQPQAHNPYMTGDKVTFEGHVYESLIDDNAWSPAAYPAGWQLIP